MAYNYEWPYTDSELHNDDWLLHKMKEVLAEMGEVKKEFSALKEYVDNYFANLNIQAEVDRAFSQLVASGYFDKFFATTLVGKRAAFFGDSLTYGLLADGTQSPDNIPATFARLTGCTVDNYGRPGDRISNNTTSGHDWMGFQLRGVDLSQYDYIFFNGGTNDVGFDIGTLLNTDTTTIVGGWTYMYNQFISRCKPGAVVRYIPTIPFRDMNANPAYIAAQGALMVSATQHVIGYVDVYSDMIGISGVFNTPGDGVHLTNEGYRHYGELIARIYANSSLVLSSVGQSSNTVAWTATETEPARLANTNTLMFSTVYSNTGVDTYIRQNGVTAKLQSDATYCVYGYFGSGVTMWTSNHNTMTQFIHGDGVSISAVPLVVYGDRIHLSFTATEFVGFYEKSLDDINLEYLKYYPDTVYGVCNIYDGDNVHFRRVEFQNGVATVIPHYTPINEKAFTYVSIYGMKNGGA